MFRSWKNKKFWIYIAATSIAFLSLIIVTDLSSIKRFNLNRDSLNAETWLEVEKNEVVKICMDSKVRAWETSLDTEILSDVCLKVQVPTLIGVSPIMVKFSDFDSSYKINLAVGMKYLDFKKEEALYGNDLRQMRPHEKKIVSVTGTYLVDEYPVTNCEITQLMWDEIPLNPKDYQIEKEWAQRKKSSIRNEKCDAHDSAANMISLYMAMKYANARSIREGLKPYYRFSATKEKHIHIITPYHKQRKDITVKPRYQYIEIFYKFTGYEEPTHQYVIAQYDFTNHEDSTILVMVDSTSDGYRLPYYDEWMTLARGGEKEAMTPWCNNSAKIKDVSKYARFAKYKDEVKSEPVGQLQPNEYGLYDMLGLVEEHVLLEEHNWPRPMVDLIYTLIPFSQEKESFKCYDEDCPSCLKGGGLLSDWKKISYSYSAIDYYTGYSGGFRLIRNIGNNAKWSEANSDKE
jgi:Uncharacterized conserved protein